MNFQLNLHVINQPDKRQALISNTRHCFWKKKLYLIFYLASNFFQGSFFNLPKTEKSLFCKCIHSNIHTYVIKIHFPFISLPLVKQRSDTNKGYHQIAIKWHCLHLQPKCWNKKIWMEVITGIFFQRLGTCMIWVKSVISFNPFTLESISYYFVNDSFILCL